MYNSKSFYKEILKTEDFLMSILHVSSKLTPFPNKPWFLRVCCISLLKTLEVKGEIAHNEQFLPFPKCFLPILKNFLPFSPNLKSSSANSFSLEESKISRLGKG